MDFKNILGLDFSFDRRWAGEKEKEKQKSWLLQDEKDDDCDFIRSIATYISRGLLPSPVQCRRLLKIVEKAEDKGYIMP